MALQAALDPPTDNAGASRLSGESSSPSKATRAWVLFLLTMLMIIIVAAADPRPPQIDDDASSGGSSALLERKPGVSSTGVPD